jgi:hypothetical protein
MWNIDRVQIQVKLYRERNTYTTCIQKGRGDQGRKEGKKTGSNNEIYHICIGRRHKETH